MIEARRGVGRLFMGSAGVFVLALGCGDNTGRSADTLSRLMDDGDIAAVAPGATAVSAAVPPPPRFCPNGDCTGSPLAFWTLDDCNGTSTQLIDSATTSQITHPAFRAVSAACVASVDEEGIRLAGPDDLVYAPDQPDFLFSQGVTVAAWINPDSLSGTQSIFRKRLDSSSSFLVAIEGGKLTFALRLTSGRTVAISSPIQAKRFTHVAATYDGQQALLYVNGAVAASAEVAGTIAPGAGPVLVGNDASGRELVGIVDDIWLDTLAAPASVIRALTCVRGAPSLALAPATTPAEIAGTPVSFDLAISNADSAACLPDTFQVTPEVSFPLTAGAPPPISVAPGQTAHVMLTVKSSKMAAVGSYPVLFAATGESDFQRQVTAQGTYVVGTGPISCDGSPPPSPRITGLFPSPIGPAFTYAASGLTAPAVTTLFNPDGSTQGLQVSANPGTTTDPNNSFVGFGWGFDDPPCLDASAYTGVQFTIAGDLGTCGLQLSLTPSENNSVQFGPFGVCTAGPSCSGPFSGPLGVGTTIVNFADLTGGTPLATLDPTALNAIGWNMTVPTDGVTAPCVANFTVTDVSFVPSSAPPPPPRM